MTIATKTYTIAEMITNLRAARDQSPDLPLDYASMGWTISALFGYDVSTTEAAEKSYYEYDELLTSLGL